MFRGFMLVYSVLNMRSTIQVLSLVKDNVFCTSHLPIPQRKDAMKPQISKLHEMIHKFTFSSLPLFCWSFLSRPRTAFPLSLGFREAGRWGPLTAALIRLFWPLQSLHWTDWRFLAPGEGLIGHNIYKRFKFKDYGDLYQTSSNLNYELPKINTLSYLFNFTMPPILQVANIKAKLKNQDFYFKIKSLRFHTFQTHFILCLYLAYLHQKLNTFIIC